jgi:hypothetical protein
MVAQNRGRGCGCCSCLSAFFLLLFALILVGLCFFYFYATNNLNRVAATGPAPLPPTRFNRQTYTSARQKVDQFFKDSALRSVILSNEEVNTLLAESPELRFLRHGVVVALNQSTAEVYCSLPVDLPLVPRRYLNWSFKLRPSMRAQELELDVSRIEREGKPLGAAEIHQYRFVVAPLIERTLWSLNKLQGDRSVRDVRIENGTLVLAR